MAGSSPAITNGWVEPWQTRGRAMADDYERRSYGDTPVGFGAKPGIVVVDFMVAFTDPQYPLGGAPLVLRAFENTVKLLEVARRYNVPVASCNTAYMNEQTGRASWRE